METIVFEGIPCCVLRRNRGRMRIAFHGGHLRVVLPRFLDPLPIIAEHRKWILEKHEWLRQQQRLAGELPLSDRTGEEFLHLVRDLSRRYGGALGVRPAVIRFRKMKSKWGSCSATGKISLNTWLQALPEALIAFIVFHELAHLKVRDHGSSFKALIRSEFPNFRELNNELKLFSLKLQS
ncbi:MAG TPA: M48 family metallopeptidase [Candidatus Binatia bacterium]|nr:M48 family metallopeptidase [Candidatus Binatia bacterium]